MGRCHPAGVVPGLRARRGRFVGPGRARQRTARRRGGGRGGPRGCRESLRLRPRRLADHGGGRADRLHAGVHQGDAGGPRGGRAADHVGDRQEPGRFGKGVRPDGRVHPRDDRGAEGAGQRQFALHRGRGHDRPDPSHALGRGPVHGPVQLSAQRDLRHPDPGPDHGQHHGLQAAALWRVAVPAAAGGVPRIRFPRA